MTAIPSHDTTANNPVLEHTTKVPGDSPIQELITEQMSFPISVSRSVPEVGVIWHRDGNSSTDGIHWAAHGGGRRRLHSQWQRQQSEPIDE